MEEGLYKLIRRLHFNVGTLSDDHVKQWTTYRAELLPHQRAADVGEILLIVRTSEQAQTVLIEFVHPTLGMCWAQMALYGSTYFMTKL